MTRSSARVLAIAPERFASAAARAGAFAVSFLVLTFATFESAFVTVAQRVASAAYHYVLLP